MRSREERLAKLLGSASIVFVGRLVGSASTVVERVIIGRLLTPAAYGEVSVALALLSFASTVAVVGLSQGVPRYVSRFDDERDRRGVWLSGVLVAGSLAVALAAVLYANVGFVAGALLERADSPRLLALFVLALPFVVGMRVAVGAMRGLGNTIYKTYAKDLLYPLVRIALVAALLSAGFGVVAAGYAYVAAAVLAFVVAHALLDRLLPLVGPVRTHVRETLRFSLPVLVSGFLATMLTWTDTLMLGYFQPSAAVGHYAAAYPIAGGMLLVLSSFGFMYLPLASRLDADGEHEEIARLYEITTKWVYVVTFPAFLTFVFFPADVVGVFFGAAYSEAALALVVLSVGFFSNAIGGRNRETIAALGTTRYLLVTNSLSLGLNVVLNLALIPTYGILGAAVASASAYVTMNVSAVAILKHRFGITPFSQWSTRTFVVLPTALLPPAYLVSRQLALSSVTLLPFLVCVGVASLVVVGLTGCLQPEDRVPLEVVEEKLGVRVPYVRRHLPAQ